MKIKDFIKSENSNDGNAPWKPTYRWMATVAAAILAFLITVFFVLNIFLKPYMREIPLSITPWLDKSKNEAKERQTVQIEQGGQNEAAQRTAE
jgi:methionyl-tRNA synthetase